MLAAIGVSACGGESLVLPDAGEPATIVLTQGDGQSGRVGEMLPQPLVLEVSDAVGRPVAGAVVAVELDGAEAQPNSVTTDGDGRASVGVRLGPEVGPAEGHARVVAPEAEEPVEVQFTVNAVAASANGLSLESGDGQTAPAGEALASPLVVRVTDAFGNPIPGIPITWTAIGGGSVSEQSTASDATGRSSVMRTLGGTSGEQFTQASSEGLAGSPVTFTHAATPGSAAGVAIVSGDDQSGVPGSQLPEPLVVRVTDGAGNAVSGAAVTWIVTGGGGTLAPPTSTTDAAGNASSIWTLGSVPGANAAEAVVSGVGQASFSATAVAGGPDEIRILSGDQQTGQVGQRLGADLVVLVLDEADNPMAGVPVAWQVVEGGGSVEPATGTTDVGGRASVRWTLGSSPGTNRLTASVSGVGSVTFQATATAGAPSVLAIATQPSSAAQSGIPFGQQPVIQLRDAAGNDVGQAGVAVTAAIASGPGSLGGTATRSTDGNGRVAFTDLRIDGGEGTHRLIFAASGFTSVTSATIDVGPPPNAAPSFTPGPNQSASVLTGAQTVPGWATNISAGPNETGQTVQFLVQVTSGSEFFAAAPAVSPEGTLTYTPGAPGIALVEVRLQDNGGTAGGGSDTSEPVTVTFTFTP